MDYKQTLTQLMADTFAFAQECGKPVPPIELFASEEEYGIRLQVLANKQVLAEKLCKTESDQQMMCHEMLTLAIACLCKELTAASMLRHFETGLVTILSKRKSDA
jgi:hypothetical protein